MSSRRASLASVRFAAALACSLAACGGGGGGGGGGGETSEVTVTLASLPAGDRQAFEAWKQRALKACSWQEAFPALAAAYPDPDGTTDGVPAPKLDVARFLEDLQGTSEGLPVLRGAGGELVVFGAPAAATASERTHRRVVHEVNGQRTTFDAAAARSNGECVITLGDEEVFRGALADWAPAALAFHPGEPAGQAVALGAVEEKPNPTAADPASVTGRIDGSSLVASALQELAPREKTLAFVAEHFGITPAQAEAIFAPGGSGAPGPGAVSLVSMAAAEGTVDLSRTTVFAAGLYAYDAAPVAAPSPLRGLRQPGTARLDLLYVPSLGPSDQLIRLEATLAVVAAEAGPVARLSDLRLGAPLARSDAAAAACFLSRHAASLPFGRSSYAATYRSCDALAASATGALAGEAEAVAVVVDEVFGRGARAASYMGWDGALLDLVEATVAGGRSLTELDPGARYSDLSARTADLAAFLGAVTDADAQRALRRPLIALAFDPYFRGRTLTDPQKAQVVTALARASAPFPDSTAQMITDLGAYDPSKGLSAARCAADLTGDRITAIEDAAAGAEDYAYGKRFASRLRGAALQACYTAADLAAVPVAVAAARQQTSDEAGQPHSPGYEGYHQDFVDHALDERWTRDAYAGAAEVIDFAMVSAYTSCRTYETLSERARCAARMGGGWSSWLSAAPGHALDPALGGRYPALARALQARFAGALADDVMTRIDLQLAYFDEGGLWSTCGNEAFDARRTELFRLLDQLAATTDVLEQVTIRGKVQDLLDASC